MYQDCSFEQCHQVLIHSKANILIIDQKKDMRENILMWIVKTSYEDFKKLESDGFGLDVVLPIEGVPVGLGLNSNTTEEEYKRLQQYINEGKVIQFSHEEASKIINKMVDPVVYKEWGNCMEGMIHCVESSRYGLHHEETYRGNEITIRIWYSPYNPNDPWPKFMTDMYIPPVAKCMHDCIFSTTSFDREITVVINRIASGYGTVIINTDKGVVQVPLIPDIPESFATMIISRIQEFVIERLKSSGVNFEPHEPNRSGLIFVSRASVSIKNFKAENGLIQFSIQLTRMGLKMKNTGGPFHVSIPTTVNLDKNLDIKLNLSDLDPSSKIYCLTDLNKGYGVNELCINGKELTILIMKQFEDVKTFFSKIKKNDPTSI